MHDSVGSTSFRHPTQMKEKKRKENLSDNRQSVGYKKWVCMPICVIVSNDLWHRCVSYLSRYQRSCYRSLSIRNRSKEIIPALALLLARLSTTINALLYKHQHSNSFLFWLPTLLFLSLLYTAVLSKCQSKSSSNKSDWQTTEIK